MATESDTTQVETASTSTAPATAPAAPDPSASSAVETIPTSPSDALAEAAAEFRSFYDKPAATEGADAGKTEEQAQPNPGTEKRTAEQAAPKEPEVPTPEPEAELPEQIRPRLKDPTDIAIAALQRAKGLPSFGEAAKLYYALDKHAAPLPGVPPGDNVPAAPSDAQKLEADIATLADEVKAEREGDNYLTPEHQDKRDRLAEMRADLRLLKFQESQTALTRQQTQAADEAENANRHLAAVRKNYPTISDAATPLGATAEKVVAEWQADPAKAAFLLAPDAATFVAAEAASRTAMDLVRDGKFATVDQALASFKAAPPSPPAPAPLSSQQPAPPATTQRRVTPAPGSKGQVTGGTPSTLGEVFASVETADQGNEALLHLYGGPTQGRRRGS